jgi:ATP-dependent Clp protease adaptor protein ClpS
MATRHENGVILERKPEAYRLPPMYKVVLLNDDFTPMEFVIVILEEYFSKNRQEATQIMLKVHNEGKGICGVFSKDIASTKVELVLTHAREAGHPLQCVMEEV